MLEFPTYYTFIMKSEKNNNNNKKILALPLGVWENQFSVGKPSCSGAGEKETQILKVVWEKLANHEVT